MLEVLNAEEGDDEVDQAERLASCDVDPQPVALLEVLRHLAALLVHLCPQIAEFLHDLQQLGVV
jgi:hypothetical protein